MRDFKGISGKAFDGRGNYNLGIREHIVFPEVDYDTMEQSEGFQRHHRYHKRRRIKKVRLC